MYELYYNISFGQYEVYYTLSGGHIALAELCSKFRCMRGTFKNYLAGFDPRQA